MILSFPYNTFVRHYAILLSLFQYVGVILYALLCGASLILMDLSNKRINAFFAAFYFVVCIVDFQFSIFFVYGPTIYLYVLMVGALLTSAFNEKLTNRKEK
jgi:hypothetical protein